MSDHYRKNLLALIVGILTGASILPAASLRWISFVDGQAGLSDMLIDGKVAFRKMPSGRATPWSKIPPGSYRFQVTSKQSPESAFGLDIADDQRITIVSFSDKEGNLQNRTFGLETPESQVFVMNLLPGVLMSLPERKQKVISGKGLWMPSENPETTVTLVDSDGFSGEANFSLADSSQKGPYLAILHDSENGKPSVAILRNRDSFFEVSEESLEIAGELSARIRIISEGNTIAAGSFDPMKANWKEVESRVFWLNLAINRDPCRLVIKGFPALRRMPSGRGSGFLKWPAGEWKTDIVVERTGEELASDSFSLGAKDSVGLISTGGGKYPNRLLSIQGRPDKREGATATPRIRIVNALPAGLLVSKVQYAAKLKSVMVEPGEISDPVPLQDGGFPGATLDFTLGDRKDQLIGKIQPANPLPAGDWVVVIHLDQESSAAPVLTWVEMDKGSIRFPSTPEDTE